MEELFELQMTLQHKVFGKRGTPAWDEIRNDSGPLKQIWVENMRKALFSEFTEFLEEITSPVRDRDNLAVELVDMMHFLIALSDLVGVPPKEAEETFVQGAVLDEGGPSQENMIISMIMTLNNLQNACKWKWWSDGGGYKPDNAIAATYCLWFALGRLSAMYTDLSFLGIKRVFKEKMTVNHARQDNGYNEDHKIKDDKHIKAIE